MLPALSARKTSAAAPSKTNKPTHTSNVLRCIHCHPKNQSEARDEVRYGLALIISDAISDAISDYAAQLNISAVSRKSNPNTISEAITTVRVVARETPSGVGLAS